LKIQAPYHKWPFPALSRVSKVVCGVEHTARILPGDNPTDLVHFSKRPPKPEVTFPAVKSVGSVILIFIHTAAIPPNQIKSNLRFSSTISRDAIFRSFSDINIKLILNWVIRVFCVLVNGCRKLLFHTVSIVKDTVRIPQRSNQLKFATFEDGCNKLKVGVSNYFTHQVVT